MGQLNLIAFADSESNYHVQTSWQTERVGSRQLMPSKMPDWSDQLQEIGFERTKKADGTVCHCYQAMQRRNSFWTLITVKQVGRPHPDAWQVTYARSEIQVGLWKIHESVKNLEVVVYTKSSHMLNKIKTEMQRKPDLLRRISN